MRSFHQRMTWIDWLAFEHVNASTPQFIRLESFRQSKRVDNRAA